jgi:vacuolar-type H+-ATPase subunit I/STV1
MANGSAKTSSSSMTSLPPTIKILLNGCLWFFAFFFAVIVGDAGYGAIFLCLALLSKEKIPPCPWQPKDFLKLLFILSYACIIWGVLTSSYFGLKASPSQIL